MSEQPQPLLELHGVDKWFGGLRVIAELDIVVNEHEIVSVIGPNGAGKTTLFNVITGIYRPDAGEIRLDGKDLVGLAPHKITDLGIARTFQTLRDLGVEPDLVATSPIKIAFYIPQGDVERTVVALHEAFELSSVEAERAHD